MGRTAKFFLSLIAFGAERACEMDQREQLIELLKEKNEKSKEV